MLVIYGIMLSLSKFTDLTELELLQLQAFLTNLTIILFGSAYLVYMAYWILKAPRKEFMFKFSSAIGSTGLVGVASYGLFLVMSKFGQDRDRRKLG